MTNQVIGAWLHWPDGRWHQSKIEPDLFDFLAEERWLEITSVLILLDDEEDAEALVEGCMCWSGFFFLFVLEPMGLPSWRLSLSCRSSSAALLPSSELFHKHKSTCSFIVWSSATIWRLHIGHFHSLSFLLSATGSTASSVLELAVGLEIHFCNAFPLAEGGSFWSCRCETLIPNSLILRSRAPLQPGTGLPWLKDVWRFSISRSRSSFACLYKSSAEDNNLWPSTAGVMERLSTSNVSSLILRVKVRPAKWSRDRSPASCSDNSYNWILSIFFFFFLRRSVFSFTATN